MTSSSFPKILYRMYGSQPINDLWPVIHEANRFSILTTTDFGDKKINELRRAGFSVIPPVFTNKEAGENSAGFLNQGLRYLQEQGETHALLMASGFQSNVPFITSIFQNAMKMHPDMDVYFALTEAVSGIKIKDLGKTELDIYGARKHFFPSESLALIKINSVYPLDEELSIKGALGKDKRGNPLGGIELLLTLMKRYKTENGLWKPNMCGIITPIERNDGRWQIETEGPPTEWVEMPHPVEYTPAEIKLARREATIDAAMQRLSMTEQDYVEIFDHTELVDGSSYMFGNITSE